MNVTEEMLQVAVIMTFGEVIGNKRRRTMLVDYVKDMINDPHKAFVSDEGNVYALPIPCNHGGVFRGETCTKCGTDVK
jgi:hypothetical protein